MRLDFWWFVEYSLPGQAQGATFVREVHFADGLDWLARQGARIINVRAHGIR